MSEHGHNTAFPKLPLYSAAALISASLLLVAAVRVTGVGDLRTPQTAVLAERMLRFEDHQDGSIAVQNASSNQTIEQIAPGTNGFLRGTLRGLARERMREGIGPQAPFRLTGRSDGRLLLEDPATGRLIDLGSFGPTNAAVFARLLLEKPPVSADQQAQAPRSDTGKVAGDDQSSRLAVSHQ